jgi:DegV family protein with EDD domain
MAVKVVTDSTADLTPDVVKELDIHVVPLNVHFGDETFKDGIDIHPDEFFNRLSTDPALPKTSQPSVGEFLEAYGGLLDAGHEIISIHVSGKLSGTVNSANQAQAQSKSSDRVTVVDSLHVGISLANVVTAVAERVKNGASRSEAANIARACAEQVQVYLMVETLEYLQKGGRIGKAQAFLGSLLQLRPILSLQDGEVHPLERTRTRNKGIDRLCELASEHGAIDRLAICHSTTPEEALALEQRLSPLLTDGARVIQTRFGPVVGVHVGPGALGVSIMPAK